MLSVAHLINIRFKVEFMHGKARLLDDKGKLIGSDKQTKGNLFYLDLGDCSSLIAQVDVLFLK